MTSDTLISTHRYTHSNTHIYSHKHSFCSSPVLWVASFLPSLFLTLSACVHSTAQWLFCSCFYFPFRHLKEISLTADDELCVCMPACCAFQMSARGKEEETKNVQNPKMVFYLFSFVFALPNGRIDHNYYYYAMRYVCVYVVFVFSSFLFFFTRPTI